MAVDYVMKVTNLDVYPSFDGKESVVYRASWTLTATDGSGAFTYPGKTYIPYNPDANWVDFSDIVEDEVLEWISKNAPAEITAVRASLALNFAATPSETKPLPWE